MIWGRVDALVLPTQPSCPIASGDVGIWRDASDGLVKFRDADGSDTAFAPLNAAGPNVNEQLLATTSATDVISIAAPKAGNWCLYVYFRVVTAATDVTIAATWTDAGGAQSATISNAPGAAVGSHVVAAMMINALAIGPLKMTATAGTANQVYVSAKAVLL